MPTRVKVARIDWDRAYGEHTAARQAAAAARRAKEDRRGDYDRLIREVVRRVQAHVSVTDAQRSALGITIRDARADPRPRADHPAGGGGRFLQAAAAQGGTGVSPVIPSTSPPPARRARPRGVIGAGVAWASRQ